MKAEFTTLSRLIIFPTQHTLTLTLTLVMYNSPFLLFSSLYLFFPSLISPGAGGFSVSPIPPWGGTETGGEGEEGAAGGATQAGEREIVQEPGTR